MFSRLFNTQKSGDQVNTQKYRNSTLIKKKKSDRIGIGDTQNFLDQIWKNGIVASLFFTQGFFRHWYFKAHRKSHCSKSNVRYCLINYVFVILFYFTYLYLTLFVVVVVVLILLLAVHLSLKMFDLLVMPLVFAVISRKYLKYSLNNKEPICDSKSVIWSELCDPLRPYSLDLLFEERMQSQKFFIILICPAVKFIWCLFLFGLDK